MSITRDEATIAMFHKATDELMKLRPSERRRELLAVLDRALQAQDLGIEYKLIEIK